MESVKDRVQWEEFLIAQPSSAYRAKSELSLGSLFRCTINGRALRRLLLDEPAIISQSSRFQALLRLCHRIVDRWMPAAESKHNDPDAAAAAAWTHPFVSTQQKSCGWRN